MELWDLYDIDRQKTGETHPRGTPVPEDRYRMVVHVAIFSTDGRMLIQQRQAFKSSWANLWDVTIGGCAVAGETSRAAAMRELEEELGLVADLQDVRPRMTIHFDDGFDDIFTLIWDVDLASVTLQESEVQAVQWATEEDIHRMIAEGTFIPYHAGFISLLFTLRNQRNSFTRPDKEK